MEITKEFIIKMAIELGFEISFNRSYVILKKDGVERKYKGYRKVYQYLYMRKVRGSKTVR